MSEPYAPSTKPVDINSLEQVIFFADYATTAGDFDPGYNLVIKQLEDDNGSTLTIEHFVAATPIIDGLTLDEDSVGLRIFIKDPTSAYGEAIGVPEQYIAPGEAATAASPFPPNVPGIPFFPNRATDDAPQYPNDSGIPNNYAPPAILGYPDPPNPTGAVVPYNYYLGHPYRDSEVVDIKAPLFGIYEVISVVATTATYRVITLTRTRSSLNMQPGSTIFVRNGTDNADRQFILTTDDEFFALGYTGFNPGKTYDNTTTFTKIIIGTVDGTIGNAFVDPNPAPPALPFADQLTVGSSLITFDGSANTYSITSINPATNRININPVLDISFVEANVYVVNATQSVSIDATSGATTLVTGTNTTFVADLQPGYEVIIDVGGGGEFTGVVSSIGSDTQFTLVTAVVVSYTNVPMEIVATSTITYSTITASTQDPLTINTINVTNLNACNIDMLPTADCPTPIFNIDGTSAVQQAQFNIGPFVTISGVPGFVVSPYVYNPTYVSNALQSYQITNWVSAANDFTGAAVAPPAPPNTFPDGSAVLPPPPLQIFSQDPTNTISFQGLTAAATGPYFTGIPSNNLVDIANITVDAGGTLTVDIITTSAGPTDLLLNPTGDIDANLNNINNVTQLQVNTIVGDGVADLTIDSIAPQSVDFVSNALINIGALTMDPAGIIFTNFIDAPTGTLDFSGDAITNISSISATTGSVTNWTVTGTLQTPQITTGAGDLLLLPAGDVNFSNNAALNISRITVTGGGGASTFGSAGGTFTFLGASTVTFNNGNTLTINKDTTFTSLAQLDLAAPTFGNYPKIIGMISFDGTGASFGSAYFSPSNPAAVSIASAGAAGSYTVTLGAGILANTTHTVLATCSDNGGAARTVNAQITAATTVTVLVFDSGGVAAAPSEVNVTIYQR